MKSVLEVDGLTKSYPGASRPAAADVSFKMAEGSALGLVGESGSGKSTTARMIAGLEKPDKGWVVLGGRQIDGLSRRAMQRVRRDMQVVFQDPYSSLNPRMNVEQLVGEGLLVHSIETDRAARRREVERLLGLVGLGHVDLGAYPRSFSGGQRQRLAIARALAVRPKLLICDEPVSSLDVSVQAQVLNLLRDLQSELGLSILFIAHDLAVVRYLCDQVVVMSDGRVVEKGSREQVYGDPQHEYTRDLLAAVPVPDPSHSRRSVTEEK
ncbi:ATP-binding cassette domain-containing protein [Kineosporia babensis]|uniref:ATP-binding cassette domain-containing protein n=1 Tax=Kineosporia babensis TaxID=499548 RepID=A0A9X1SSX4_9ACTN|nr:ATP-binding cassette domain-containing protein [Kineosporia babensis]